MKIISAIIRPQKLETVTNALDKLHVVGMTVTDVRGFGRQKGQVEHYRGEPYTIRFIPKVKIEVVVQDEDVNKVMTAIAESARTGQVGDGKIFVSDVPNALRIRTGKRHKRSVNLMTDTAYSTMTQQAFEQLHLGNFESAIEAFSACLVIEPNSARVLQGRGMALIQLKQWKQAETDFAAALALDNEDVENSVGLGMALAMQNDVYSGLKVLETYFETHPKNVRIQIQLGMLNFKLGAINKGKEYLRSALTCRPLLAERRLIEANLSEQEKLDQKRYYKPDFAALNRRPPGYVSWLDKLKNFFKF